VAWVLLCIPVFGIAVAAATVIRRRTRPDAPTQPTSYTVPSLVDRRDFDRPEASWLVVVFTSSTCDACAGAVLRALPLDGPEVAVQEVSFPADRALHARYAIDAVPMVVVADAEGEVRTSFVGVPTAADLWAAVAELREPGSTPSACIPPNLRQPPSL
jgi:hypothetical protein